MKTVYLRQVRRMFKNDMVPASTVRHNSRSWVRMVRLLGDKWVGLPTKHTRTNQGASR